MPLTPAQKLTLRTNIQANTTQLAFSGGTAQISAVFAGASLNSGDAQLIADWYNLFGAAGTHTVWRKSVPLSEIAKKLNGTELAGLTSLNHTRLQTVITLTSAAGGADPSLADQRSFWDDIFSGAGGATTRAALLILWKRLCRNVEKLFATGTGSDASPADLGFEGTVTGNDISDIKGLPA